MAYYLAYSRAHFDKRWSRSPRHVVERDQAPYRGARGTSLCGVRECSVTDTGYPIGTTYWVCKRCVRAHKSRQDAAGLTPASLE